MSSSSSASSTDAAFGGILKQFQAGGLGAELRFADAFFSFLRRNTSLLAANQSVEQIQQMAMKHVELAKKEAKEKAAAAKAAEEKKRAEAAAAAASSSSSSAAADSSSAAPAAAASSSSPSDKDPEDPEDSLPTPINNGGVTEHYRWSQTLAETSVSIALPAGTSAKQLQVVIEPNRLHAQLLTGDKTVFVSGEPDETIDSADATWTLESSGRDGGKTLEIFLPKKNKMSWWKVRGKRRKRAQ